MSLKTLAILTCLTLLTAPVAAGTYKIDGLHSSAIFKIRHMDVSNFYGTFHDIEGKIVYDDENVGASSIEVSIAAESVDSRTDRRNDHIKSPDFLNAKQFPKITFKSKSVRAKGDKLEVIGDLTLLGVSKEITVIAEKTGEGANPRSGNELIGFEARFRVDRTDHDMGFMVGPVGKDIEFILAVEAVKQ